MNALNEESSNSVLGAPASNAIRNDGTGSYSHSWLTVRHF